MRGGPSGVVATGNRVDGGEIGLQVRDARVDVRDNVVTGATSHGVSVVGAADGSTVEGNSLAGAGASALDVVRVTSPAVVTVGPNDVGGWHVRVSLSEYVSDTIRDAPAAARCGHWCCSRPSRWSFVRRRLGSRPYVEGGGVVEPPAYRPRHQRRDVADPGLRIRSHASATAAATGDPRANGRGVR